MSASRHRSKNADDEDAAQLKFGPEFGGEVQSGLLSTSEVKLLLDSQEKKSDNAVFKKTSDYVNTFARFNEPETVDSVRRVFHDSALADFEFVQIINLCPATSEEAKALIPSLGEKTDDDTLQQLLNQVASLRKFQ